jgi:Chemotaxis phosphatase CheX
VTELPDRDTLGTLATDAAAAMFSLPLEAVDNADFTQFALTQGHAVVLRLHGNPAIFVGLACHHQAGAELASIIFEVTPDQADEAMIADALRELTNIFAGQVKSLLVPEHQIGLPRVQKDDKAFGAHEWHGVRLRIGDGDQVLDLALAA